jgi:hypothetical protein
MSQSSKVELQITQTDAIIQNSLCSIKFDLEKGIYSGFDLTTQTCAFRDAYFRIGEGGWKEQELTSKASHEASVDDSFGKGETLRVWMTPLGKYEPERFLDITLYESQPFFVLNWGVKNQRSYPMRIRSAELLVNGEILVDQQAIEPKVLRGGAGADENFVEDTTYLHATNSGMLTYRDQLDGNQRKTIVAGGLHYSEFLRFVDFHERPQPGRNPQGKVNPAPRPRSYMTLTVFDPQGKRVAPGETWTSDDSFFVDIVTSDPIQSLECFGQSMATANNASPNPYDFITLCGWMTSMDGLGDGLPINNSPGLIGEMEKAVETGVTKYADVAVRLEPDYYCYEDEGDTQQGWFDDEHWAKYGTLLEPYPTFKDFCDKIKELGGKVFTYVQGSMPSNDFALEHPEWVLNKDISLLYEHRKHARTKVRYDYSHPGFQKHLLDMWTRLGKDGVIGLKFDYPESGWAKHGGFDDDSYTTVSAYRKIYQLCRAGLGKDGYVHERIMGSAPTQANVPCTDVNVGIVDLQRVWPDASHFEPEMASRMGLRWYKQGVAFRYYPDGKSFFPGGVPASTMHRRTFLTLVGLLSGRLELGTSFTKLTDEIRNDVTRLFPTLPNGKAFRPVDFLLGKKHPECYVYSVDDQWAQVVLVNNDEGKRKPSKTLLAPVSGSQADTGSLGLKADKSYHVFEFWSQEYVETIDPGGHLKIPLLMGESKVVAVREALDHPQILGTNRHIMCGMMDVSKTQWNEKEKSLIFNASVVEGEEMIITTILPKDRALRPTSISGEGVDTTFSDSGKVLKISIKSPKSLDVQITLGFE